jgi:two-component system cell cycle sensor histidine kinase/response regulator CckA
MAINDMPEGHPVLKSLSNAMLAADNAAKMSGMMLTYLGHSLDKHESLDLSDTCRNSLPMLQVIIAGNVALETDFPFPGPVISTNINQIQQILINLSTNACEAVGDKKGTIRMTVKTVSPSDISSLHRHPIDWQLYRSGGHGSRD